MEVYGDQVDVNYVMGGLVKDMKEFQDPANEIGGKNWYIKVADHWLEASGRHGMPVDEKVFYLLKDNFFSAYPASIAFKAAEFQGTSVSKRFLRRLREATSAEKQLIDKLEVQLHLAKEVGLDEEQLHEDIKSGKAEKAFKEDLMLCRKIGVRGFPTFSIQGPGDTIILNGFTNYSKFDYWIQELSDHSLKRKHILPNNTNIYDFIERYGKVALVEVATVFDIDRAETKKILDEMLEGGLISAVQAGNDYLYSLMLSQI